MKKMALPLLMLCCYQCMLAMEQKNDQSSAQVPDYLMLSKDDKPIESFAVSRVKSLDSLQADPDLASIKKEVARKSLDDLKKKSLENLLARRRSSQELLAVETKKENNEQQQQ